MLGPTAGLRCLDLGSDNGVVSLLLRERGGDWASGRPDGGGGRLHPLARGRRTSTWSRGDRLPFADATFDRVAVVDMLEHVADEAAFVARAGAGHAAGRRPRRQHAPPQADPAAAAPPRPRPDRREARPPAPRLHAASGCASCSRPRFAVERHRTYSRFFSEAVDTALNWGMERLGKKSSAKGMVVTGGDVARHRKAFRAYSRDLPVRVGGDAPRRARPRRGLHADRGPQEAGRPRRPFEGAAATSLLSSILKDGPAPVRSLRPDVEPAKPPSSAGLPPQRDRRRSAPSASSRASHPFSRSSGPSAPSKNAACSVKVRRCRRPRPRSRRWRARRRCTGLPRPSCRRARSVGRARCPGTRCRFGTPSPRGARRAARVALQPEARSSRPPTRKSSVAPRPPSPRPRRTTAAWWPGRRRRRTPGPGTPDTPLDAERAVDDGTLIGHGALPHFLFAAPGPARGSPCASSARISPSRSSRRSQRERRSAIHRSATLSPAGSMRTSGRGRPSRCG